ncbi:MAG: hypothetical protein J5824_03235 [Lachnospiraceae bacterium]|nr:hypothetical protein [Lachnospiraceae bacterium]
MNRKTAGRFLSLLLTAAVLVSFTLPKPAEAASVKTKIKKLIENMRSYEWVMLFDTGLSVGEGYEVVLSDTEKATAAAYTVPFNEKTFDSVVGDLGWEYLYNVSNKRIKSMSKKLFGKAVSYKKIPKGSYEDVTGFMGVYRSDADKVMLYVWDGETETDTETIKLSIKKSGKGYAAVKELYHGYWGWNDHKTANYRVTYKIEKNSASSYGYVITGMTIECIANIDPRED